MSLIHEALKKAEQRRQLGTVPTLDSPVMPTRRRRAWWRGPILAFLGAVVLAGATWLWWRGSPAPPQEPIVAMEAPAVTSTVTDTPPPPITRIRPQAQKPVAEAKQERAATPNAVSKDTPATPEPSFVPEPVQPDGAARTRPTKPPRERNASAGSAVITPPAVSAKPAPVAVTAPEFPLYWELPYAERKDLPEFKISMHVYSDAPEERFVILNGVRHVEGDNLGNDMKLRAIDPDGLVVQHNGKSFRVPRNGGY